MRHFPRKGSIFQLADIQTVKNGFGRLCLRDLNKINQVSLDEINWFLKGSMVFDQRIVLRGKEDGGMISSNQNTIIWLQNFLGKKIID